MFVDFITHFPAFIISVATCVTCMGCLTCVYYVYTSIRDYYLWATGWNYSYTNEPASSQHTGPMYYFARLVEYENEIRTDHNGYIANPNSPRHPPGYSVPFQGPITPDLPQPAMLQGKFSEERIDNSNVSYFQNLLPTQTDEYHPLNQNTYSVNNFRLPTRTYIDEQTMTQTIAERSANAATNIYSKLPAIEYFTSKLPDPPKQQNIVAKPTRNDDMRFAGGSNSPNSTSTSRRTNQEEGEEEVEWKLIKGMPIKSNKNKKEKTRVKKPNEQGKPNRDKVKSVKTKKS